MVKDEDKERDLVAAEDLDNVQGGAVIDFLLPELRLPRLDSIRPLLQDLRRIDTLRIPSPFARFGIDQYEDDTGRS